MLAIGRTTAAAARPRRERRPDHDDGRRPSDGPPRPAGRIDARQFLIGNQEHIARSRSRRAATPLRVNPRSSAPAPIGRTVGAQRQIRALRRAAPRVPAARGTAPAPPTRRRMRSSRKSVSLDRPGDASDEAPGGRESPPTAASTATSQSTRLERAAASDVRELDPVAAIEPPIVQASLVAKEELVHRLVGPGSHADDDVVARLERGAAALRAIGTDRTPQRSRSHERALLRKSLDRSAPTGQSSIDIARPRVGQILPLELADHRAVAALADVEHRIVRDIVHEPHASRAEDASIADVQDVATEVLDRD